MSLSGAIGRPGGPRYVALAVLAIGTVWAQPQVTRPAVLKTTTPPKERVFKIAPQTFLDLERRFDRRLETLVPDPNEPIDLLGDTRGVYVDGCGVVFTAEISLVKVPELNPFLKEVPKTKVDHVHQLRVERLPILKEAMDEMLHAMAMTFVTIPSDQRMVLVVRLRYKSWEFVAGMPAQATMSGTRAGVQTGEIKWELQ